jgi:hypothetical protein
VGRGVARLRGQLAGVRASASSSETSIPPPEVVMILLPLNEKIPARPNVPGARPL